MRAQSQAEREELTMLEPVPSAGVATGNLMAGKRGLIMGVANNRSIAWGIAKAAYAQGAEIALTYQGEAIKKRVGPLAAELGSQLILPCDVTDAGSMDAVFAELQRTWGRLDFLVHAIAFSDKNELDGRYVDTSEKNFVQTMLVSCYSLTALARRAEKLMPAGGSMLTLTYYGAEKVMPHYNVMGVAKAALEASVRYLAADLGPQRIRVNALSAGPMRTVSGAGVSDARVIFNFQREHAPLKRTPTLNEVGGSALYLLSDLSGAVTGEVHFVDCGYSTVSMPSLEVLKALDTDPAGARTGKSSPSEAAE